MAKKKKPLQVPDIPKYEDERRELLVWDRQLISLFNDIQELVQTPVERVLPWADCAGIPGDQKLQDLMDEIIAKRMLHCIDKNDFWWRQR
jgi:hypothetical protein